MSEAIPMVRGEPGTTLHFNARMPGDSEVETSGTDAYLCRDLLTGQPLIVLGRRREDDELTWDGVLAASELTSLSFLADEPDLYGEEDGERL